MKVQMSRTEKRLAATSRPYEGPERKPAGRVALSTSALFLIALSLVALATGCKNMTVRAVAETRNTEWNFEGEYDDDYPTNDEFEFDAEVEGYNRFGFEGGFLFKDVCHLAVGVGAASITDVKADVWKNDGAGTPASTQTLDGSDTIFEPEGAYSYVAVRGAVPAEGGFGPDWGARLGIHHLQDERSSATQEYDYTLIGVEFDANLGFLYALALGDSFLFVPRCGVQSRSVAGSMAWTADDPLSVVDYNHTATYSGTSVGFYGGVDLSLAENPDVTFSAHYFRGTEDTESLALAAGIAF